MTEPSHRQNYTIANAKYFWYLTHLMRVGFGVSNTKNLAINTPYANAFI